MCALPLIRVYSSPLRNDLMMCMLGGLEEWVDDRSLLDEHRICVARQQKKECPDYKYPETAVKEIEKAIDAFIEKYVVKGGTAQESAKASEDGGAFYVCSGNGCRGSALLRAFQNHHPAASVPTREFCALSERCERVKWD